MVFVGRCAVLQHFVGLESHAHSNFAQVVEVLVCGSSAGGYVDLRRITGFSLFNGFPSGVSKSMGPCISAGSGAVVFLLNISRNQGLATPR